MAYSNAQATSSSQPTGQRSPRPDRREGYNPPTEPLKTSGLQSKSRLDGEVSRVQMTKRPRERSGDERRLLPGHDSPPAHAPALDPMPEYCHLEGPKEASAKRMQGRALGGRSFRPVDTLHNQPHAPKAVRNNGNVERQSNGLRKLDPPQILLPRPRGSSGRPSSQLLSNNHVEHASKRQKFDHIDASSTISVRSSSDSTSLKSSMDFFDTPVGRSAQKTPYNPTSFLKTSHRRPERSISRKVDAQNGLGQEKNKRKSKDGVHSSQRSTVSRHSLSPSVFPPDKRSTGSSPLVLTPDGDAEFVSDHTRMNASQIDAHVLFKNGASKPLSDHRLRDVFQRDVPEALNKPSDRAPQRMKAASNEPVSSHANRTSTGSVDELSGETTIGSPFLPRESFERRGMLFSNGVPRGASRHIRGREQPVQPNALSSNSGSKTVSVSTMDSKHSTESTDNKKVIELKRILCRACYLEGGDLNLVWIPDAHVFRVKHDGEYQTVPHRNKLVEIGGRETKLVNYDSETEMLAIQIKGSANDISNGSVLLEASSLADLNNLLRLLQHSLEGGVRMVSVPQQRMEGIVKTQGSEIKKDHDKNSKKVSNDVSADLFLLRERKRRHDHQIGTGSEEIKYEPEDGDQTRSSKQPRMHSGDPDIKFVSPTASKYLSNDSHEPRRSSRQPRLVEPRSPVPPPPVRWTRQNKLERWSHSVVYPPEGSTRRVTVDFDDIERLDEGEFLNDSLISFALRRIEQNMHSEHKKKVHFFNSFFYEALTKKNGKKGFYYDAVSRWTKNKDLFDCPYVVVPINIDMHWFVVIICNLNRLQRKPTEIDLDTDSDEDGHRQSTEHISASNRNRNATLTTKDPCVSLNDLSLSDEDTLNNVAVHNSNDNEDGSVVQVLASDQLGATLSKKGRKKGPPPSRKYDPDAPTIITLDSFGSTHSGEVRILKDYLNAEAESKRGMEVNAKDLQGLTAKGIPEQTNFCDCGVFLVGYIEEFAKDPRKFVTKVLQREIDRHNDFAGFDPSAKRAEIREELLKLQGEQDADRKAKKSAKKMAGASQSTVPPTKGKLAGLVETPDVDEGVPSSPSHQRAHVAVPATLPPVEASRTQIAPSPQLGDPDGIPMAVPRPLPTSPPHAGSEAVSRSEGKDQIESESIVEVPDSQEAAKPQRAPRLQRMVGSF